MTNGYSQVYGNCFIAFDNICRYAGTYHHLYGGNSLVGSIGNRSDSCIRGNFPK